MKNKKLMLSLILVLASFIGNSQTTKGKVLTVMNLGSLDYSIINDLDNNSYYQTSPYNQGELVVGQLVTFNEIEVGQVKVTAPSLTTFLYASIINSSTPEQPNITSMPELIDGILYFEDMEHYESVYDELDGYRGDLEEDDYFDLFEANFIGFTSYRTEFNTKWNLLEGEFSHDELMIIYDDEIVFDDLQKTLLNEDRLIGIGDEIIYQHAQGEFVTIDKNDEDALNVLMSIDPYADLLDPRTRIVGKTRYDISIVGVTGSASKGIHVIIEDELKYESFGHVAPVGCEIYRKAFRVDVVRSTFDGSIWDEVNYDVTINGMLSINWGDNTNNWFGSYEFPNAFIDHEYSQTGTYDITYTYIFEDADGNNIVLNDIFQVIVSNDACGEGVDDIDLSNDDGSWKMLSRAWFDSSLPVFGGSKGGCYTHAYKKVGNKWKRRRADIMAKIEINFRHTNNNCAIGLIKTGESHWVNRKKVRKVKKIGGNSSNVYKFGDEAVKTLHYLQKSGTYLQRNIILDNC
jgi:hypothetical protein